MTQVDDDTINDLGYVWGKVIYDDMEPDQQMMWKNLVKAAAAHMGKQTREHIDWPFEVIANYDY